MIRFSRDDVAAVAALVVLAVASWVPRLRGPIDLRWDGGAYYVLGKALAQGQGYRLLNEPGEIHSTLHPPMLPAMFGFHQWVLQSSDPMVAGHALRLFYFVLFVSYTVAVYLMLRGFLPSRCAVVAAAVCLFQLHTIFLSDLAFPELPFALATVLFVQCHLKAEGSVARRSCALLAVISVLLRTVGLAVLAAWSIDAVCRRRLKATAGSLLLAFAPVLGWAAYVVHIEFGSEYQKPAYAYQRADYNYINVSYAQNVRYKDPFSPELGYATPQDRARRFLANWTWMPSIMAETVSTRFPIWDSMRVELGQRTGIPTLPSWSITLAMFTLSGLIVVGQGILWARGHYFIPLYTLFSLVLVCATPWPGQFNRYLMPLAPFFSLSLFLALHVAVGRFGHWVPAHPRAVRAIVPGTLVVTLLLSQAATVVVLYSKWHSKVPLETEAAVHRLFFYQDLYRATDLGLRWLKGRAMSGDVVAATDPQWAYLRTGLKAVLPPFEINAATAQEFLDSVPVKYLIVDESVYRKYTAPVVARYPDRWRRVYADVATGHAKSEPGSFEIYERIGAP